MGVGCQMDVPPSKARTGRCSQCANVAKRNDQKAASGVCKNTAGAYHSSDESAEPQTVDQR